MTTECLRVPWTTLARQVQLAFLGLESYEAVLECFSAAKRDLGEVLR